MHYKEVIKMSDDYFREDNRLRYDDEPIRQYKADRSFNPLLFILPLFLLLLGGFWLLSGNTGLVPGVNAPLDSPLPTTQGTQGGGFQPGVGGGPEQSPSSSATISVEQASPSPSVSPSPNDRGLELTPE